MAERNVPLMVRLVKEIVNVLFTIAIFPPTFWFTVHAGNTNCVSK